MSPLFVPLSTEWADHPKLIRAGLAGRGLHVLVMAIAKRLETDGWVDRLLLYREGADDELIDKLVDLDLLDVDDDHPDAVRPHNWHRRNPSQAAIDATRDAKADAGRRANHKRWKHADPYESCTICNPNPQVVPGCDTGGIRSDPKASPETETETETSSSSPPPTPTMPPTDQPTAGAAGEEENRPITETEAQALVDAAVAHMAECDLRRARAEGTPIRQPDAWTRRATENRRTAHGHQLLELARNRRPGSDPVNLAEAIDDTCGPHDGGAARAQAAWQAQQAELAEHDAKIAAYRAHAAQAEAWLDSHPDERDRLLDQLPETDMPDGAGRAVITRRSLIAAAIDHLGLDT